MRFSTLIFALAVANAAFSPSRAVAQSGFDGVSPDNDMGFSLQIRAGVYLGVHLADIDADRAKALKLGEERGVEVVKVEPGSPADSAGIKAGDVLLSYNGENILSARQLGRLVSETPEGRRVKIQLWRDGKTQMTAAIIAESHARQPFSSPDVRLQMPDIRLAMPDIPNALLVWKTPALGIECEPVDNQLAQFFGVKRGVLVRSVEKGSAADKAGLRAGDVLTAIGDRGVESPRDVMSYLRVQRRAGKPITLALTREHRELKLSVSPEAEQPGIALTPPQ
jgi:serine protease Do